MENFLKILVAVLLVACVPYPGDAAVPTCPAVGSSIVCYDCLTRGDCTGIGNPADPGTECAAGEACKMVTGVATCMPLAQVPQCNCGGADAGCDAYNSDFQIFCIPVDTGKSLYLGADCSMNSPSQTCSEGLCADESSDVCTAQGPGPGFFLETPNCASGVFCDKDSVTVYKKTCEAGQYFNKVKSACEAYPPNPCAGCTGPKCPIISDCSKYAVCNNGVATDNDESCEEGKFFDPVNQNCEGTSENEVCKDYQNCNFESTTTAPSSAIPGSSDSSTGGDTPTSTTTTTTTSTPTTTTTPTSTTTSTTTPTPSAPTTTRPPCTSSNSGQRYPHETDCKKYYTCRDVTRNSFRYVESTCLTPYVFNPTILKCDEAFKVPGCQAST